MTAPFVQKAAEWLASVQLANGGWGETCATYEAPWLKGQGPATPSQTAWAVMGLMAAGRGADSAVERGVRHLLTTQRVDGTWDETACTGTGFPGVYYLTYGLYRDYFPLMALGLYRRQVVERAGRLPIAPERMGAGRA
jgi:squalene-hopene/tetraprenyl-beta-curcumene cyclase